MDTERKKIIMALLAIGGLTVSEVARLSGFSRRWITAHISGQKKSAKARRAIADALGMTYEAVWGASENANEEAMQ